MIDVPLGQAPPTPYSLGEGAVQVTFTPEITGYAPQPDGPVLTLAMPVKPDFAGLIPGAVGIYQINVKVPTDLVITGKCYSAPGSAIVSNVRVKVTGSSSLDEVGICAVANP